LWRRWTQSLRIKARAWPGVYHFEPLLRSRNLRQMTADLVREYTEFPTLTDYLSGYAITGGRLASLSVPAFLLSAADDPIIPIADLERLAPCPLLRIRITEHGGHCGFVDRLGAPGYGERFMRTGAPPSRTPPARAILVSADAAGSDRCGRAPHVWGAWGPVAAAHEPPPRARSSVCRHRSKARAAVRAGR